MNVLYTNQRETLGFIEIFMGESKTCDNSVDMKKNNVGSQD